MRVAAYAVALVIVFVAWLVISLVALRLPS